MSAAGKTGQQSTADADCDTDADKQPGLFEASVKAVETPSYHGHRERLRSRLMEGGAEAMPDYELLELVLFKAYPRGDTKDLAKRLIARFGSFAEVINAPDLLIEEGSAPTRGVSPQA